MSERVRLIVIVFLFVGLIYGAWRFQNQSPENEGVDAEPVTHERSEYHPEPPREPVAIETTRLPLPEVQKPIPKKKSDVVRRRGGKQIFGVVVNDLGEPIENATVEMSHPQERKTIVTKADGEFSFKINNVRPQHFVARASGHAPGSVDGWGASKDPYEFRLLRTSKLEGFVVAMLGREPIQEFSLLLKNNGGEYYPYDFPNLKTYQHETGAFELEGVYPTGKAKLFVRAKGFADTLVPIGAIESGATHRDFVVAMPPGNSIRGQVVNEGGSPIEDAWVMVNGEYVGSRQWEISEKTLTDEEGFFEVGDLAAGITSIYASKEGYRHDYKDIIVKRGGPRVTLRLVEGGTLRGLVRLDGKPVSGAAMKFTREGIVEDLWEHNERSFTDEEGMYNVSGVLEGYGMVSITFDQDGVQRNMEKFAQIAVGNTTETNFDFETYKSSVEGRIQLTKTKTTSGEAHMIVNADGILERRSMRVSSNGRYSFKNVPPGKVTMKVYGPKIKGERMFTGELLANQKLRLDAPLYGGRSVMCSIVNEIDDAYLVVMVFPEDTPVPYSLNEETYEVLSAKAEFVVNASGSQAKIENIEPGVYTFTAIAVPSNSGSDLSYIPTASSKITVTDTSEQNLTLSF